jgi:hypothetical protein
MVEILRKPTTYAAPHKASHQKYQPRLAAVAVVVVDDVGVADVARQETRTGVRVVVTVFVVESAEIASPLLPIHGSEL